MAIFQAVIARELVERLGARGPQAVRHEELAEDDGFGFFETHGNSSRLELSHESFFVPTNFHRRALLVRGERPIVVPCVPIRLREIELASLVVRISSELVLEKLRVAQKFFL